MRPALKLDRIVDASALDAQLNAISSGRYQVSERPKVLEAIKSTMQAGRSEAEKMLLVDGSGMACAERLSYLMDTIISALFRFATNHVYCAENPSTSEQIAVVATGGYGRGTLAPGSDLDLLFLTPYKQSAWGEQVVEFILYMLWDLGLKVGHATRSVDDCIRLPQQDVTIRTAVLESRFILGSREVFDRLTHRFDNEVVKGTGPAFIQAKLMERDQRHARQGESRYLVEPNVKEGKGGLRDLQTLYWISKYYYRVRTGEELVEHGVFSAAELSRFRKAEDFLWAVRCHMHFVTGKSEERLSFDIQREIAARLKYRDQRGLSAVERFMKHYFLHAKDVGDLTRIVCSALEEAQAQSGATFTRIISKFRRTARKLAGHPGFVTDHNRLNIENDEVFRSDPVNLVRLFHLADRRGLEYHPDAIREVTRCLNLIDRSLRDNAEANRLFVEIVASTHTPELTLRRMNESGVLGRFVPEFGKIVAMMQFNMYHHYTVDEHSAALYRGSGRH